MKRRNKPNGPRRKALGRGLDALLADRRSARPDKPTAPLKSPATLEGEEVRRIPVERIDPNPSQPRTVFDAEGIEELAQSIRADGLIQPILLRPHGERYLLVVGERRLRAAKLAGMTEIPAILRHLSEEKSLELALVENIQRENLNPIEVARALERMSLELRLSHEELAQRTGKNRTTITNFLRLLKLPAEIQDLIATKELTMGHARALLALPHEEQQLALAHKAIRRSLSVRQVEQLVREILEPPPPKEKPVLDPNIAAAVEELERALGARVRLVPKGVRKGRIEIEYGSPEELDRIYSLITGSA